MMSKQRTFTYRHCLVEIWLDLRTGLFWWQVATMKGVIRDVADDYQKAMGCALNTADMMAA